MKKFLAVILALVLCFTLVACGEKAEEEETTTTDDTTEEDSTATETKAKPEAYFIACMSGGAAWSRAEKGFNDACSDLGITGYYLVPVERYNYTQMSEQLDTAINAGGKLLIGCFWDEEFFGNSLNNARANGAVTAVLNWDLHEKDYIDVAIGTAPAGMGKCQGEALVEMYEKDGVDINYVIMEGSASQLDDTYKNAIQAAVDAAGLTDHIKFLEFVFDESSATTAAERIKDYVKANPDCNACVCLDSSAATMGVANFVQENGLEDSFYGVGIDASEDILNYVKQNALCLTINQDFYTMGYQAVEKTYDMYMNGTAAPADFIDSGCFIIHADEADEYAEGMGWTLVD